MKKQTKLVAVTSAAALLAIGASMTSFAATGWTEEDGTWYFYDKDGNKVENEWKKSGDNWYWLDGDESGAMATDKLVDDDDNTYYVDSTGVMVKNTWVKVVNEDQDDDDPAEYHYYYMQASGKAYKAPDSNDTKFRTIDGKRYAFDTDGKMLYGWVNGASEMLTDEDEWASTVADTYYCGSWEDGAMKTGWQRLTVHDNTDSKEDDYDYFFWFKSNGKRYYNDDTDKKVVKEKSINGRKYGFDDRGVMVYTWTITTNSTETASAANWKYFNSPEDGARVTKGWFKVVAPIDEDNSFVDYGTGFADTDAEDEKERWYYADGDGNLAEGQIKKVKGKYYGFRPEDDGNGKGAAMLNGLVLMQVNKLGEIVDVADDDVDSDDLDDILDGKSDALLAKGYSLYYFGNDEDSDGAMKTGSTTVNLDGNSYNFYFSKTGGVEGKGKGQSGIDDDKYIYKAGCRIKADSDDKYQVVKVTGKSIDLGSDYATVEKKDSRDFRVDGSVQSTMTNNDNEHITYVPTSAFDNCYLVNASGNIQKTKSAAKDGADWYFYTTKDQQIIMYVNNKNFDNVTDAYGTKLADWKSAGVIRNDSDAAYYASYTEWKANMKKAGYEGSLDEDDYDKFKSFKKEYGDSDYDALLKAYIETLKDEDAGDEE